eukprot:13767-Chlamydomonas_euryale.AAC.1
MHAPGGEGALPTEVLLLAIVSLRMHALASFLTLFWQAGVATSAADEEEDELEAELSRCGGAARGVRWVEEDELEAELS